MLVLSRKAGERVHIGPRIVLTVLALKAGRVRLAFEAPKDVAIFREEVRPTWLEFAPPEGKETSAPHKGLE
jgi:carbon storage regulator